MKKILAIALAVAMMMAAFAVGASAEAAPIVFTAQSVEAEVGDIITVDIGISENHYMVNAQIWIEYDPNSLEIQEVWDDIDNPYFEEINTKIIKSNAMWAFAVPSPGTAKFAFASSASTGTTAGGTIFTLTFKVLDTAASTSEIVVSVGQDDMCCNDGVTNGGEDFPGEWSSEAGVITVAGGAVPPVEGDLTADGVADADDAALLFYYVNGMEDLTEEQLAKADVNGNGVINLHDAGRLFYMVNGLI